MTRRATGSNRLRIAVPDMVSPSYFPAIAAVELGCFAVEGLDASIELVFPVTRTYEQLRAGTLDYVGGAAHAALYVFDDWEGCKLLCALSQHMYWFLVVARDIASERGDLSVVEGLRIGAAPGPVDGLKRILETVGIDPDNDVEIGPVPGSAEEGASFGVAAARALEDGVIDGFWANGLGAEVAVRRGVGTVVLDARRGNGPRGAENHTFAAFVTTQRRIDERPDEVAAAVRAVTAAQRQLSEDPSVATDVARPHFGDYETELIAGLITRDAPFYDPEISEPSVIALNRFAHDLGLLSRESVPYARVVATGHRSEEKQ